MVQYNSMRNMQKGFILVVLLVLVIALSGVVLYFVFEKDAPSPTRNITTNQNPLTTTVQTPKLSGDKKSIVIDGNVVLTIDHDTIFNWFKTKSHLCDKSNLTSTPDRKSFCEDKTVFKSQTRFTPLVISPDHESVGFAIESDTLSPDKVVGIFSRTTKTVTLMGSYYLGSEFISFSPSSTNFVYTGECFEGMCTLYVKNLQTLLEKASLNDSAYADMRTRNATFVRWISDNEIEYKLGTEVKRASF